MPTPGIQSDTHGSDSGLRLPEPSVTNMSLKSLNNLKAQEIVVVSE